MISENIRKLVEGNSVIRAMFEEGKAMEEKVGAENVFDFSIGNPNVPAPDQVKDAIIDIVSDMDPVFVHGYMNNAGFPQVRKSVAEALNRAYSRSFTEDNIIMTVGAGSALNVIFKTMLGAGDKVVTFAPYFVEYGNYLSNHGAELIVIPPREDRGFLPDSEDLRKALTPDTKAVIINNPNNPTGRIYPEELLWQLAKVLGEKAAEYGHPIYIISDEPYRELAYGGRKVAFIPDIHKDTIIAYSYSKSMSLPGERIGYILVPSESDGSMDFIDGATIVNRILGYVNAPSLMQLVVGRWPDLTSDISYYEENSRIIYQGLKELGFEMVEPEGGFYLWIKAPSGDDNEFIKRAREEHILLVPGSAFGGPGWVRLAYCADRDKLRRSLEGFGNLARYYGLSK